eukprot:12655080-Alexandrium_andersonii.AAC.1
MCCMRAGTLVEQCIETGTSAGTPRSSRRQGVPRADAVSAGTLTATSQSRPERCGVCGHNGCRVAARYAGSTGTSARAPARVRELCK